MTTERKHAQRRRCIHVAADGAFKVRRADRSGFGRVPLGTGESGERAFVKRNRNWAFDHRQVTDETGPEDFKRLLRVFDDVEKMEPKARSLPQWLAIARDKGLKYHSWIDAYALARIEELPADVGSEGAAVEVGAGATAKRNEWTDVALKALWQESILPGMTQKVLAEKFGVTPQSISKQLKRASERFSKTKSKTSAKKKTWLC